MNDLARPAPHDAWHDMTFSRSPHAKAKQIIGKLLALFVSPAIFPASHNRPLSLEPGDLLAVMSAGAYGMAMSSNYNTRACRRSNGRWRQCASDSPP